MTAATADIVDMFAEAEIEEPVKKRTRQPRVDADGNPIPRKPRVPRNAKLEEELLEAYVSFASDIAVAAPTVSGVLISRAERTTAGLVALASGSPKTMAALKKVAQWSKGADLLQTLLLVLVAAAVDLGRISATHPILDSLGDVQIRRGPDGKPVKDEFGLLIKDRTSLRDIYDMMHGSEDNPTAHEEMDFDRGPGIAQPNFFPPMNWIPQNNV